MPECSFAGRRSIARITSLSHDPRVSFSGIGGFDLAAEWAGWTNVFNCDIDPFCRKVLKFHFPNAVQYEDIRTTDFTAWRDRIDVLTGGFPCQPFSVAGNRKGTGDDRYLWPEMLGAVREIRPRWVVGENVLGIVDWSEGLVSSRCVLTWKMRATKSNRLYFQLVVSMPHTKGIEYGLLPTAQTQGLKICVKGKTVFMPLGFMPTPTALDCGSGRMNRSLSKGASERPTLALAARMGMLPTPTANDARNVSLPPSQAKRDGGMVKTAMRSDEYRAGAGFRLNPRFVAEMMGFPVDWTALPFQVGAGNPSKPTATP